MKISVIMGVYNDLSTIDSAIVSILNQTYDDFEFIIFDDCSTQDIYTVLKKYSNLDKRIVLLKNEKNLGLSSTLNKCLSIASGEYVARMDGDDIALPERFEKQVKFLDSHPDYALCSTNAVFFDDSGDIKRTETFGEVTLDSVFKYGGFIHPTVMIRRDILNKVGGYTSNQYTIRCEDYDLWNKIYFNGYKGYVLKDVLFRYRETKNNIKKRRFRDYKTRSKAAFYWRKKHKLKGNYLLWCYRPILVGLVPKTIYVYFHNKKVR